MEFSYLSAVSFCFPFSAALATFKKNGILSLGGKSRKNKRNRNRSIHTEESLSLFSLMATERRIGKKKYEARAPSSFIALRMNRTKKIHKYNLFHSFRFTRFNENRFQYAERELYVRAVCQRQQQRPQWQCETEIMQAEERRRRGQYTIVFFRLSYRC